MPDPEKINSKVLMAATIICHPGQRRTGISSYDQHNIFHEAGNRRTLFLSLNHDEALLVQVSLTHSFSEYGESVRFKSISYTPDLRTH